MRLNTLIGRFLYLLTPEDSWDSYTFVPKDKPVIELLKTIVWISLSIGAGLLIAKAMN